MGAPGMTGVLQTRWFLFFSLLFSPHLPLLICTVSATPLSSYVWDIHLQSALFAERVACICIYTPTKCSLNSLFPVPPPVTFRHLPSFQEKCYKRDLG